MTKITADLEVQIGKEATDAWGTAVAPTAKLMGVDDVDLNPIVDVQQIEELRGTRVPAYQSLVHMVGGEASIGGLLSYDDLPYWLQGIFGRCDSDASGPLNGFSSDTSQVTKVYGAPVESSDNADAISYTCVYGDEKNIYALNGATVNSLSISGETGAPLEFTVEFIGKNVTTDAFASLSDRSVTYVMGDHVKMWLDPGSNAPGTTAASDVAFSFDMTIDANREPLRHLNDLTPTSYREDKMSGTLSLTLEHDSDIEDEIGAIISATKEGVTRNIRLDCQSGDSDYIYLDFAGVLSGEPDIFQDVDGVITADLELTGQKTDGASDWFAATVCNNVETLA